MEAQCRNPVDWIVIECVPQLDIEGMQELMGHIYSFVPIHTCPSLLGWPIKRPRTYTVLLRRGILEWHPHVHKYHDLSDLMKDIFDVPCTVPPEELMRAPQSAQSAWIAHQAMRRGLPEKKPNNREWSSWLVLPPGQRQRLGAYEAQAEKKGCLHSAVVSLSQHAAHQPVSSQGLIPTLTRNTQLWSMKLRRSVLPIETVEMMGVPMFAQHLHSVAEEIKRLNDSQVRCISGNAMHAGQLGAILLLVLCLTQRAKMDGA